MRDWYRGSCPGYIHPSGVIFAFQGNHNLFWVQVNTRASQSSAASVSQNCSDLTVSIFATGLTLPGLFVRWVWRRLRLHLLMKQLGRLSTPVGLHGRISSESYSITSVCKKPGTTTPCHGALNSQTQHWRRFVISHATFHRMSLLTRFM